MYIEVFMYSIITLAHCLSIDPVSLEFLKKLIDNTIVS